MKILIAVDATPSCHPAVQAATARPWLAGTSFVVATAIDPAFFARSPALLDQAKVCVRRHLEQAVACLNRAGCNATADVILGNPRRVIGTFARDWQADLVMAG